MTKETIYKTEDGLVFNSEKEALAHETSIKQKLEESNKRKAELDSLRKERDAAYEVFKDAHNKYIEANTAYRRRYKDYYNLNNSTLDDFLNSIFN